MVNFAAAQPQPPSETMSRRNLLHTEQTSRRNSSNVRSLSPLPPSVRRSESRRKMFVSANRGRSISENGFMARSQKKFSSLSYSSSDGGSFPNLTSSGRQRVSFRRSCSSPQTVSESDLPISPISGGSEGEKDQGDTVVKWEDASIHEDEECTRTNQQDAVANYETRSRMYSEGTLIETDEETMRDFISKRRAPSTMDTAPRQRFIFGRAVPLWCTTKPKATVVAAFLAKYAPCFWCSSESLSLTTTNQAILLRLNSLTAFFALVQLASASFLCFVLFNDNLLDREARYVLRGQAGEVVNTPNLWSVNGTILFSGGLAVCTFIGMLSSRRHLRDIDVPGSLRLMWVMLWVLPIELYLFVSMFDYHKVSEVWVKHWWSALATAWFRARSCEAGTYNTLCVVPIRGLPIYRSENDWCLFYYNSTACTSIRNSAQIKTIRFCYWFYTANGVVGILVFLLVRAVVCIMAVCPSLVCSLFLTLILFEYMSSALTDGQSFRRRNHETHHAKEPRAQHSNVAILTNLWLCSGRFRPTFLAKFDSEIRQCFHQSVAGISLPDCCRLVYCRGNVGLLHC